MVRGSYIRTKTHSHVCVCVFMPSVESFFFSSAGGTGLCADESDSAGRFMLSLLLRTFLSLSFARLYVHCPRKSTEFSLFHPRARLIFRSLSLSLPLVYLRSISPYIREKDAYRGTRGPDQGDISLSPPVRAE